METVKEIVKKPPPASTDDEIAVSELHFDVGHRMPTLPLEEPRTAPTLRSHDRVAITYLPRKRFYRVVEKSRHDKAEDIAFYIPETWALWVP